MNNDEQGLSQRLLDKLSAAIEMLSMGLTMMHSKRVHLLVVTISRVDDEEEEDRGQYDLKSITTFDPTTMDFPGMLRQLADSYSDDKVNASLQ